MNPVRRFWLNWRLSSVNSRLCSASEAMDLDTDELSRIAKRIRRNGLRLRRLQARQIEIRSALATDGSAQPITPIDDMPLYAEGVNPWFVR
jgi:hypothetical protein